MTLKIDTTVMRSPWTFGEITLIRIVEDEKDLLIHPITLLDRETFEEGIRKTLPENCKLHIEEYIMPTYRYMLRGYIEINGEKRYFFNFTGLTYEEIYSEDNFNTVKAIVGYISG